MPRILGRLADMLDRKVCRACRVANFGKQFDHAIDYAPQWMCPAKENSSRRALIKEDSPIPEGCDRLFEQAIAAGHTDAIQDSM